MRPHGYSFFLALAAVCLLAAAPAQAQYGTGVVLEVPHVEPGTITLDGAADEAAWNDAVLVDLTAEWDPFGVPAPDVAVMGRLLFSEGVLYVHVLFQDYQDFYWGEPGLPYQGEQLLVGVDLTHAGDDQQDGGFGGWPDNAPNLGPTTYKMWQGGITHNWGFDGLDPVGEGWVAGTVFVDDDFFEWGVEMAIYGAEITQGGQIGFNIGGATASQEWADDNEGDGAYGYFAWQVCDEPTSESFCQYPGGNVMADAGSFATLQLGQGSSVETLPGAREGFVLRENYPNPFRGTTTLVYDLAEAGTVELVVYDVLGRQVAVLEQGLRPAGTHRAALDGATLSSGLYLARLAVDGVPVSTRSLLRLE